MSTIAIVGATGNLGGKILRALVARGAHVVALVRPGTSKEKLAKVEGPNVKVVEVDLSSVPDLTRALQSTTCVVSAINGLRDIIIDTQKALLDAAVAAGVPRFIPTDFSIDFYQLPKGINRNLDLRREFNEEYLNKAPIKATSILNGGFMELLTSHMPMLDFKGKKANYWGDNPDVLLDFTHTHDVAEFAAAAALDPSAPRYLRIAGSRISPREFAKIASEIYGEQFELNKMSELAQLEGAIKGMRAANPASENDLFPQWQGMQYMHNMYDGRPTSQPLDTTRYPDIKWITAREHLDKNRR